MSFSRRRESTAREWEIERFRRWVIPQFTYNQAPPGFRAYPGGPRVDWEGVNDAIKRFLTHGFRYPHYPHSNF